MQEKAGRARRIGRKLLMGRAARLKPEQLAGKLLQIRLALGLSQNEMIRHLGLEEVLYQSNLSGYETGEREPPLPILLRYARAANVWVDVLIDDELVLPSELPSRAKHEGLMLKSSPRKKSSKT
jgi:transcriptional regulator with XRE-family HTH domain